MSRKALTLIEIIISLVIFVIVITGLVGIFVGARGAMLHSRSRMAAAELTKYFLDPLQMDVNQSTWGNNCLTAGNGCPGQQYIDGIRYTPTYARGVPGFEIGLRSVRVTINWNENPY
jgi:Tfp pilus assembly protein PilV